MSFERLRVGLDGRGYDIVVGAGMLARAGTEIAALKPSGPLFVVTDENVARLHLPALAASLDGAGLSHAAATLPAGEASKSFAVLERLAGRMLDEGLERGGLVLALGGGVIGDLAGFAAGIVKRGVSYVQIPTTLLAQVDSSVGGKTAIDMPQGKNTIGLFHQPRLVLSDTGVLDTLPPRELRAGFAEILKYGLISDADFAAWAAANARPILSGPGSERTRAILTSCRMKASIVEIDEKESGARALLNLGHTFAHAIEACAGYSHAVLHGEAVAVGCALAFDLSARLNLCPPEDAARVRSWLQGSGLAATLAALPVKPGAGDLIAAMRHDKKAAGGRVVFVLARGVGKAFVAPGVDMAAVEAVLKASLGES